MFLTGPPGYNELADYIDMLYKQRKQDSVIFFGTKPNEAWLRYLVMKEPLIFRGNNPMFMPSDYLNMIELKLDTNIIFYEKENDGRYNLVDTFAVRGGPPISLGIGSWDDQNGIILKMSISRWDRRTDLKRAIFRNCLHVENNGWLNYMIRNKNGKFIGVSGFTTEILISFIKRLNLILTTRVTTKPVELLANGTYTGWYGMLQRGWIDVDSTAIRWVHTGNQNNEKHIYNYLPMDIYRITITLYGPITYENTLDMWAYVEVFGTLEWTIFFVMLLVLATALTIAEACFKPSENDLHLGHFLSNIAMALLFCLQGGSHSTIKGLATKLLSMTVSMLTLFMFICYANDITAEMTSGSPQLQIHSFDDVIDQGFRVTMYNHTNYEKHFNPVNDIGFRVKNGSAKHKIFMRDLKNKTQLLDPAIPTEESRKWQEMLNGGKLLLYASSAIMRGLESQLKAYDLKEKLSLPIAFLTPRNSEFSQILAHYILKQRESGIIKLDGPSRRYLPNEHVPRWEVIKKIGINEPQPLGYTNVMFIFAILGGGMCVAVLIACVECITKKVTTHKKEKNRMFIQTQPAVRQGEGHGRR